MRILIATILGVLLFYRCTDNGPEQAQNIIDKAIKAHGHQHLENVSLSFTFRDKEYSVTRTPESYTYTRSFIQNGDTIRDILVNSKKLTRLTNGQPANVPDTMQTKYSNSVNSVLYFVQLPYLLNDPAVNKTYKGTTKIEGGNYQLVKVTFDPNGGGTDHQDEYLYWFNQENGKLDYLAYNYDTDGGGVRFRVAYNRMERGDILFQDYVNYEAPIGTPLSKLPALYEQGTLKELSRIENQNIRIKRN